MGGGRSLEIIKYLLGIRRIYKGKIMIIVVHYLPYMTIWTKYLSNKGNKEINDTIFRLED